MNAITKMMLGGTALCALATAPALAGDFPDFHVTALHAGNVVNKTAVREPGGHHLTYTFEIYTIVPTSDLGKTVDLSSTAYTINCTPPVKAKVAPKKTEHAKIGIATETTTNGCVYDVATYKLTKPQEGLDSFVFTEIFDITEGGVKYKGVINMDVSVTID